MDALPLWLIMVVLCVALPLSVEAGYRLRRLVATHRPSLEAPPAEGWSQLVGGAMSLLTLLLAFTVSMATDRYDTRRRLVVDEANAISTTYLRTQTFSEPARTRLSLLIAEYAKDRRAVFMAGDDRSKIARAESEAEATRNRVWSATLDGLHQPQEGIATTAVLQATNQMFDLAASRHAALEARVPPTVLTALIAYSVFTAGLVGYGLAWRRTRHAVASTIVFLMVATTISLIINLDRPRSGTIRVSESPIERVSATIAKDETAKVFRQLSTLPSVGAAAPTPSPP